jgi:hypothetical protein
MLAQNAPQQLAHRLKASYVEQILEALNSQQMDAATAAERLQVGRTRVYELRTRWLRGRKQLKLSVSGGNHLPPWPAEALTFLEKFLPSCQPLNYALLGDELQRRFRFRRSRAAIAAMVQHHYAQLVNPPPRGPKPRRRWQTAAIGELWQHDSSPHAWWSADCRQSLILTLDDHSRKALGGVFVPADTTWDHFCHLRRQFEQHGLPAALYTDGLSLFGHESSADRLDTCSQFQRALGALGVAHRVAPDAPAKGKIERRFGYLQNRLVSVFTHEKVRDYERANQLLAEQIDFYNQHQVCRTTGLTPNEAWERAQKEQRSRIQPCPALTLLDLHLALHVGRRLNADQTVDFLGRTYPVAACSKKTVTIVHHPKKCFWVLAQAVDQRHPVWPTVLGKHSL